MIRVMIVASAIAVRAGLRALISDDPQIEVVAEAGSMEEMNDAQPEVDVVIWSPGGSIDQQALTSEMSNLEIQDTAALLLIHNNPQVMMNLTQSTARAWGLLGEDATQAELITSIQALNEGLAVTSPIWLQNAFKNKVSDLNASDELIAPLTVRETEILQLLAHGLTNKQIAARLKISTHTVKFHVSAIFNKMGTTNRVETVNLGLKKGLIVL